MKLRYPKSIMTISALSLIMSGGLAIPTSVQASPWLAPAASEEVRADWVKAVETELRSEQFKNVFINAPGGSPQSAIIRLLNQAAIALKNGQKDYAQGLIEEAIHVVDRGVEKGWYTKADVKPLRTMIMANANNAFEGKFVPSSEISDNRWTGYTHQRELGLTERLDMDKPSRFTDEAEYRQ